MLAVVATTIVASQERRSAVDVCVDRADDLRSRFPEARNVKRRTRKLLIVKISDTSTR
jgi:hypothetical protein